jgi:hypothetical protein
VLDHHVKHLTGDGRRETGTAAARS